MNLVLMVGLCFGTICLVRAAVGVRLPESCPRRTPLPARQSDTIPLPVDVQHIRERLELEELGLRWCRDRCGAG
ncbi:hypothetical protein B7C42_01139 [Nocardia cerradoensis]|uniref:Uncharacterized protein n=1 Tax=Nocardia cerradoensis TaxID=85688 RepID=A0A231HB62_9NOCA|nr:hypothetical protein [Nocardia cerradoensis]OXR46174.1 hypothetical protein B7C42_01139 [Nocardia cerradoensis]